MTTVTAKRHVTAKPSKSRFTMTKEELSNLSFQTLAHWLKEDMEELFVGLTKTKLVDKLYNFYQKTNSSVTKTTARKRAKS